MRRCRGGIALPSLAAGAAIALSLPPWGWWPLAVVGAGVLYWRLDGLPLRSRVLAGWVAGLACFVPGLWWAQAFTWYGAAVLMAVEALSMGIAAGLVPRTRGRFPAFVGAFTLSEAVRMRWPFGGLPIGGVFLGQAGGPFLATARLGGPLLVTAVVWAAGAAGESLVAATAHRVRSRPGTGAGSHRRVAPGLLAGLGVLAGLVALTAGADHAPDGGRPVGYLRVAAVQGGGPRGLSDRQVSPASVFARQLAASTRLRPTPGQDLVVWPEDVIALAGPPGSARSRADEGWYAPPGAMGAVAALARRLHATVVAGVTFPVSDRAFRNEVVAWRPDGTVAATFEKVHRVPFGEYVPDRGFFGHLADLSAVPLDAIPGHGTGLVRTPAGPLGLMVSYEVFFADRSRSSVGAGARVLVVPTNTSSYSTGQVPAQEVAADEVQAVQTGRDLVQAAPTGYSTLVDSSGRLVGRTVLGRAAVLRGVVALRTGRTLYVRFGDGPVLAAAALALAGGWAVARRHGNAPAEAAMPGQGRGENGRPARAGEGTGAGCAAGAAVRSEPGAVFRPACDV